MTTTLKLKAYISPLLYFFASIIFWIIDKIHNTSNNSSFIIFIFLFIWGNIAFLLFSYYKEYSIDNKHLIIRHLITRKQIIIPLTSITSLKIKEVHRKNDYYHNIIVETYDKKYILKGTYVHGMTHFFNKLDKMLKK
jgi:hypothetical protein